MRRTSIRPACEPLEARALLAVFTVTSQEPSGPGSLAAAINHSNNSPGRDTINFDLPEPSIFLRNEALPAITRPVVINGYSQPGTHANDSTDPALNNAEVVTLYRTGGADLEFLTVNKGATRSQIRGLGFANIGEKDLTGITLKDARSVIIDGCNFGSKNRPGSVIFEDVLIEQGERNTVGESIAASPQLQNVMTNYINGVAVVNSTGNSVVGNLIGGPVANRDSRFQALGVVLHFSRNNDVVENILTMNKTSIRQDSGADNFIEDNTIIAR